MRRAGIILIVGVILIGAAYVVGFWPQYENAQTARRQVGAVTLQLDQAQAKLRLCGLQNRLLAIINRTEAKNYGDASRLSTQFFDQVREEVARRTDPQVKSALQSILQQRDTVTSDMAKGDPALVNLLNGMESTMFSLVNNALNGAGGAVPAATTAPAS